LRYFFEIQYDGSNYHGWQYQPNAWTIQEAIEEKLSILLGSKTKILGCGRTDTGVHASQYFFHVDTDEKIEIDLCFKMNGMLNKDIVFKKMIPVAEKSHARFDASLRAYTYLIRLEKDPFAVKRQWIIPYYDLDVASMQTAAKDLMKYNDFPNLCKAGSDVKNFLCDISKSELQYLPDEQRMIYNIEANRFLRNMIRRIVGLLIQIGKGQLTLEEYNECLAKQQAFKYINLAPPEGLYLSKVAYPFALSVE